MAPYRVMALFAFTGALLSQRLGPAYSLGGSILTLTISLFLLQVLVHGTWSSIIYPKLLSPLRHIPTAPGGNFLMGQLFTILREPSGYPHLEWSRNVPNKGLIRYTHAFNSERLFVTSPKGLAEVLVHKNYEFVKPKQLRVGLGRLLGVGVLLAEGDEHKKQRKDLSPAFAFRHTKNLYPVFWEKSREVSQAMLASIQQPTPGVEKAAPIVEVGGWASRATLDIIGVAGMGKDFRAIENPDSTLNVTYRKVFSPDMTERTLAIISLVVPQWIMTRLPFKQNNNINEASKVIRRECYNLIQHKKDNMAKGSDADKDILSVALTSGGFTDDNLVDQMMTFLAAGHETTATAMTWAILELGLHPDIQERLRNDIRAHLPSLLTSEASITAADIEAIPYLHAVCNEILRFHPPVGLTLRVADKDTSILDQFVPKDTIVILSPHAVNRSPALWGPDADTFDPERWMKPGAANSGGADSNYSYLTFLHGPRSCIGQGFAKAEFATLLAAWTGAFAMELENPEAKIEIQGGITSRPKGGIRVKMSWDGKW